MSIPTGKVPAAGPKEPACTGGQPTANSDAEEDLGGQQAEYEPAKCLCGSNGEATPGILCAVLTFLVRAR